MLRAARGWRYNNRVTFRYTSLDAITDFRFRGNDGTGTITMEAHQLIHLEPNPNIQEFQPGDTVRVEIRVTEGERTRLQAFQGVVIRKRGGGPGASFTVRRVSYEIGVERTFLLYSPNVESVRVVRRGKVRRARLYYLRGLSGRAARIKERR